MSAISRQEERQFERKGVIFAAILHGALILLCFFWIVLKKTNMDEGGTPGDPVNFGFNELGSGDNNSLDQVATQVASETQQAQEPVEASTDDANLTTTDPAAETVISEPKKPTTPTTTPSTTKPTETTTKPTTNPNAQMGSTNKTGVNSGDGDSKQAGNQGNPNGTLDDRGYYGTGGTNGTGGGKVLNMNGWHLDSEPKVPNADNESGKVVFIIKIDGEGSILSLSVKENQVSQALVKKCEYQIRNNMEFVKNNNNGSTAPSATGEITFVFRVN